MYFCVVHVNLGRIGFTYYHLSILNPHSTRQFLGELLSTFWKSLLNPSTNTNKLEDFRNKSQQTNRSLNDTGKSVSEALVLKSVNPQYDDRLFIDYWLQYKKNTNSEHVVYKNCFLFWHSKQFLCTKCSEFVFFWVRSCKSMNNLSSYCGLTDSRMSASDTDLPVLNNFLKTNALYIA